MDDLLATNPVAPLPQKISSLGQCLTEVVINCLNSKAEAELAFCFKQPSDFGVIAKVLSELGYLKRAEGEIALGAVVLHDILGGLILKAVLELTSSTRLDALDKFENMLASKH